jgi:hypothetical protein
VAAELFIQGFELARGSSRVRPCRL